MIILIGFGIAVNTVSALTPDLFVSNENELRQAVAQAGKKTIIISLTRDIELISNFNIPSEANITLISDDGYNVF